MTGDLVCGKYSRHWNKLEPRAHILLDENELSPPVKILGQVSFKSLLLNECTMKS
jgi:hypothetical protein